MKSKIIKHFVRFIYNDLNKSIPKEDIEFIILLFLEKFKEKLLLGYTFKIKNFCDFKNHVDKPARRYNLARNQVELFSNNTNNIRIYLCQIFKKVLNAHINKEKYLNGK